MSNSNLSCPLSKRGKPTARTSEIGPAISPPAHRELLARQIGNAPMPARAVRPMASRRGYVRAPLDAADLYANTMQRQSCQGKPWRLLRVPVLSIRSKSRLARGYALSRLFSNFRLEGAKATLAASDRPIYLQSFWAAGALNRRLRCPVPSCKM
jgi:hypothetical protein